MRVEFHQTKNGLPAFAALSMNVERPGGDFLVHRLHALVGQRAGVLALLLADLAEARVDGRIVLVRRKAVQHAARAELRLEGRVLRVVHVLRFLLGVEVVEVAEPLIEPVDRGQHVVAVAEVVLAELAGRVAERLEQVRRASGLPSSGPPARPAGRPW